MRWVPSGSEILLGDEKVKRAMHRVLSMHRLNFARVLYMDIVSNYSIVPEKRTCSKVRPFSFPLELMYFMLSIVDAHVFFAAAITSLHR